MSIIPQVSASRVKSGWTCTNECVRQQGRPAASASLHISGPIMFQELTSTQASLGTLMPNAKSWSLDITKPRDTSIACQQRGPCTNYVVNKNIVVNKRRNVIKFKSRQIMRSTKSYICNTLLVLRIIDETWTSELSELPDSGPLKLLRPGSLTRLRCALYGPPHPRFTPWLMNP